MKGAHNTTVTHAPFWRRRRPWLVGVSSFFVVILVLLAGITWYYAGEIHAGAFAIDREPDTFDLEIVAIDGETITLRRVEGDGDLDPPGTMGLEGESGFGHATAVLDLTGDQVVRGYFRFSGELGVGDSVRYDRSAYPGDPLQAFGLDFADVQVETPLGMMPAWFVPGDSSTWAVLVHGRTSDRGETLRALEIFAEVGLPVLSISFRNDVGVAEDPGGEYQFGITEWEDLHAAVRYALSNGAQNVVLAGFSMGGAIISHFMMESPLAGAVSGIVLDAPLLDLDASLDLAASRRGVPEPVPSMAQWVTSWRYGIDWSALDTIDEMAKLEIPVLLFHGTEDPTIPVSQSDRFAEIAGPNVTYVRVDGAIHVGSWNVNPAAYRNDVLRWLEDEAGL